jgi:hypothetical protein
MNFIEIYDNVLTKEQCNAIVSWFEEQSHKIKGLTYDYNGKLKVDNSFKSDIEIPETYLSADILPSQLIYPALCDGIERYKQKYISSIDVMNQWRVDDEYNLQKYDGEEDGFKKWHCESAGLTSCHRILAWMIYLNQAQSGTEFVHYRTVRPRTGRLVIWPASWTHVHRSQLPNRGLKYIATGWVSFV